MDYVCQEYRGEENGSDDDFHGCDGTESQVDEEPPKKKIKGFPPSNFTKEDAAFFAQRVSMDMRDAVMATLLSKEGEVVGILTKMQNDRSTALSRRINLVNHDIWKKLELMDEKIKEIDAVLNKLEGMGKFTYAWCKSAQEAGIYKMKQR